MKAKKAITKEDLVKDLKQQMSKEGIEGIIYVEKYNVILPIFTSELGRHRILMHARKELAFDKLDIENEAMRWLAEANMKFKQQKPIKLEDIPSYAG